MLRFGEMSEFRNRKLINKRMQCKRHRSPFPPELFTSSVTTDVLCRPLFAKKANTK